VNIVLSLTTVLTSSKISQYIDFDFAVDIITW
jgi:hypothetical protein